MRPDEAVPGYLWDMRRAARETLQFVEGYNYDQFLANRGLQLIVERELEIVGEAARRIMPAFRDAHPEIPWRDIVGQRNILAHEYGNIEYDRIWRTIQISLTELLVAIEPLIPFIEE